MGRKRKIKISRIIESDEYAAYRPSSPKNKTKDFSTGYHTTTEKEKQKVQAESSQGHAASDTHLDSEKLASNEEQRDKIAHSVSGSGSASGDEMDLKMEPNIYDRMKKFLQERYEAALPEAVIYGEQERGSSNEIHPSSQDEASSKIASRKNQRQSRGEESQGQRDQKNEAKPVASQDIRGKSQSQDSSVPASSIDQPHSVESIQKLKKEADKLEEEARSKGELLSKTKQEHQSIIENITNSRKERIDLKKEYKPKITEKKKLKNEIEKQEKEKKELNLQLDKTTDKYAVDFKEIIRKSAESELLYEDIKKRYEIKKSILEYLDDRIREEKNVKSNFKDKLQEIRVKYEKIDSIKKHEILQKNRLENETWIKKLERIKAELEKERNEITGEINKSKTQIEQAESILKPAENSLRVNPFIRTNNKTIQSSILHKNSKMMTLEVKKHIALHERLRKNLDGRIKAIEYEIEHRNTQNTGLAYMKILDNNIIEDKILLIMHYYNKLDKTKDYIKELESRYRKIQENTPNVEELKEANRIAEQKISQCHFNHRFYLMERKHTIIKYELENEEFIQKKKINIQTSELAQDDHGKVLNDTIESLNKKGEEIERRIKILTGMVEKAEKSVTTSRDRIVLAQPSEAPKMQETLDSVYDYCQKTKKKLSDTAKESLENKDDIEWCKSNILEIDKNMYNYRLKEIEAHESAKSNLEKEIDTKLKIIESQFNKDLKDLQQVRDREKSELERLRSELEDLEKTMHPETQKQELKKQFEKEINEIQYKIYYIDKGLQMNNKILEEIENDLDEYRKEREKLTKDIENYQNKSKEKEKELDRINAEFLKTKIAADIARRSYESSVITRARNSMERRNVSKTTGEICPISYGLQEGPKNGTSEYLREVTNIENDYGTIINEHKKLDKLNQILIKLHEDEKILRRSIVQKRNKIRSIYKGKHKLENEYLEQRTILNKKREEYIAINHAISKLQAKHRDCFKIWKAVGNVIAMLNSEISTEEEGQKKLTSQSDEINTKTEQLNALNSQSHTIRQQSDVRTQEVKGLFEKELKETIVTIEQQRRELQEKIKESRKDLKNKRKEFIDARREWKKNGRNLIETQKIIDRTLAEKYELSYRLIKVKRFISAIESTKRSNKTQSGITIKNVNNLLIKDNPTVPDNSQKESNKPSEPKSILKKSLESQENQGRQVKQVRFVDSETNTSQTAFEKLKDPLQAWDGTGEEEQEVK